MTSRQEKLRHSARQKLYRHKLCRFTKFEKKFMKQALIKLLVVGCALSAGTATMAKLPALTDEAKAKSAEAAAKSAWTAKLESYQLCKSQDRVAAQVKKNTVLQKETKSATKDAKTTSAVSSCIDPRPFVYAPAAPLAASSAPASSASQAPKP